MAYYIDLTSEINLLSCVVKITIIIIIIYFFVCFFVFFYVVIISIIKKCKSYIHNFSLNICSR